MNQEVLEEARKVLEDSLVYYQNEPVGTVAAKDLSVDLINYDQVFTRDFVVSGIAFLLEGRHEVVKNFLTHLLFLQSKEKSLNCFRPGRGMMPASFKVDFQQNREVLLPDFGEKAIGRVAPVDAPLWWIYLLRIYVRFTNDGSFARRDDVQHGIRLILDLCLNDRFDQFPTLLVPDGSFMIDRRMGVYGYPLDIQSLFYLALRSANELLVDNDDNKPYREAVLERLGHLTYHIRTYYWMDFGRLNELYRSKVELYGEDSVNRFNIYPDTIPRWLGKWIPDNGGYFVGNLGPARMDFRFFTAGNLMTVLGSLASPEHVMKMMALFRSNWSSLVGHMPIKVCYPALRSDQWRILTGSDPKNTAWSYQNAGGWPFLVWLFTAVALLTGDIDLVEETMRLVEARVVADKWPEYYDGSQNRLVGKQAMLYQTWTAAGYIVAQRLVDQPEMVEHLIFREDVTINECTTRAARWVEKW